MRGALPALFLLCLGSLAAAEDLVYLDRGGVLGGRVVSEEADAIVLEVGAGRVRIPRARIRLIERGATARPPRRVITRRDEWFLVLLRGKVVGWRRIVHTEGPGRVEVEERTVYFREGGGDDVDVRRVEVEDGEGNPIEFLHMETYGDRMEVMSGQAYGKGALVQVRRHGRFSVEEIELPKGWRLALPAYSRFLATARGGEKAQILALDPRTLQMQQLRLRREEDRRAPEAADPRPCRAIELASDEQSTVAYYRQGEGAVAEELAGPGLLALRVTEERVDLARRAHAAPEPLSIADALLHPLQRPARDPAPVFQDRGGIALRVPDRGWIATVDDEAVSGRLVLLEKVALFSTLEIFSYPAEAALSSGECLERALRRLHLAASCVDPVGDPEARTIGGRDALLQRVVARHREEDLRCLVAVVPAKGRYLVVVGASPERWWRWAEGDFESLLKSMEVAD